MEFDMKPSFWDIFSIFLLLGVIIVVVIVGTVFSNPASSLNPFPPATQAPTVFVPSATLTREALPPTWTAVVEELQPSETIAPRSTSTPIPTRTPFILPSPTKIPALIMPTNTRIPLEGRCKVAEQDPKDGTRLKMGTEFHAIWTLQNTGEASWDSQETDVRFKAGNAMQTGPSAIDLPVSVPAGATTEIKITMKVPDTTGYHIAYWTIVSGDKTLCTFYIEVFAEK
jgi:hypothetical protein